MLALHETSLQSTGLSYNNASTVKGIIYFPPKMCSAFDQEKEIIHLKYT